MIKQSTLQQAKKAHRQSLLSTLEHRLEIARTKGQDSLVNQLEAEKRYYLN
ncbi:MAG: hypothetical protein IGQ45_03310 [Cyanobacterium sp. T60_A2020_053]|nr:hypothetical protein [Cyanobacterium sp. T60_A2020_053]